MVVHSCIRYCGVGALGLLHTLLNGRVETQLCELLQLREYGIFFHCGQHVALTDEIYPLKSCSTFTVSQFCFFNKARSEVDQSDRNKQTNKKWVIRTSTNFGSQANTEQNRQNRRRVKQRIRISDTARSYANFGQKIRFFAFLKYDRTVNFATSSK